jgi:hypothetical protein
MSKTKVANPTGNGDGTPGNWIIASTPLSCGLRVLEGWSEGVGIPRNASNFENRFYALLKLSASRNTKWGTKQVTGAAMAPIGVGRFRLEFLEKNDNYVLSSNEKWIDRFSEFVKKYDLGSFSRTHGAKNLRWHKDPICVAHWTWNGNVPSDKDFEHVEIEA